MIILLFQLILDYIHSFLEMSNDFSGLDIPSLTETIFDDLLNSPERLPPVVSNSDRAHDLFIPLLLWMN